MNNIKLSNRSLNDLFPLSTVRSYRCYPSSNVVVTKGISIINKKVGLDWLIETILCYQKDDIIRNLAFQVWTLERVVDGENIGRWQVALIYNNEPVVGQIFVSIMLNDEFEKKFDVFTVYMSNGILLLPCEY